MPKGVAISYGDIAVGAKENFNIDISESKYDTTDKLYKYNAQTYNYANPCELYQTVLDGTAVAIPFDIETANIGLWSEQLSNDDGIFDTPITIVLESENQYSSQGFTFAFDKYNNIHPAEMTIQWFRVVDEVEEDLTGVVTFNPTSGFYFCHNQVENFNKVIINFYSLNMPKNRLKLETIDYGYGTVFYGDNLRNVKLSRTIDPISSQINISTCDFSLDSNTDIVYSFQTKQPVSVYFNNELLNTMFVKSSLRKSKFLWDVNTEDYIGVLDTIQFLGGMYSKTPAGEILEDIFISANVPYSISEEVYNYPLTGYIPLTTSREALMQVCFASMAIVNTANTDVVEVKKLDSDIKQTIPLSRIYQGQSFSSTDVVTNVELTVHSYNKTTETIVAFDVDETEAGIADNIFVSFSEPLYDLTITNGEIIESGANYAIINADAQCVLSGKKYNDVQITEKYKNNVVLASDTENVSSITSATLVSSLNAQDVLENCVEWLLKTDATSLKILIGKDVVKNTRKIKWGEQTWGTFKWGATIVEEIVTNQQDINIGDTIEAETEYLDTVSGVVISESFSLNGNTIAKDVEIK